MAEKKINPLESQPFAKPIKLADVTYTHFKLREATLRDMFDAEMALASSGGGVDTPLTFNGQMMVYQLVEVSNESGSKFEGPFTLNLLSKWGVNNYTAIRSVQKALDLLGEANLSDSSPG